jgi:hypothetical protein
MALPLNYQSLLAEQNQIGMNASQYIASPAKVVFAAFNLQDKTEACFVFQSDSWSPPEAAFLTNMLLSLQTKNPNHQFQYSASPAKVVFAIFSSFESRVECFAPYAIPYSAPGSKRSGIFLPVILRMLADERN